ncbi:hypothetical protein FNB79_10920 [Formosa sediminum]|uniref:DUF3299 domain-containing protein n=1 Tax=Formosa sediminum TaxID=2594004 RepID=A0A516GSF6_9FLAO|nr:hypothetical protein [Formosa sediminum]QDO94452.1 hypothetical protein FNB79_10920 [Formosa sediminum]
MKNKLLLVINLVCSSLCFSQQTVTWDDLSHVSYSEKKFPGYDEYFLSPIFLNPVKALEGKQISVTGFFLNIAPEDNVYILSKGPMSSCFFCGEGESNTIIELQFKDKPYFKTDALVTVTGTLKLNSDDVEHFIFILNDCKAQHIN